MATEQVPLLDVDEEECFSIELIPMYNSLCDSIGSHSPPHSEKSTLHEEESYIIFKGEELLNLLSLGQSRHPQIVQKDIKKTNTTLNNACSRATLGRRIPLTTDLKLPFTNAANPFGSRRYSSYEPNQYEFLFERFSERFGIEVDVDVPKKSWSHKLKETKKFCLSEKLKASEDYLKSLFTKSKSKDSQIDMHKKYGSSMNNINTNMNEDGSKNHTRRSFLSMFQRHCSSKDSPLSTLSSDLSSNVEAERLIEEAIAYCKQSMKKCGNQEKAAFRKVEPNGE